MKRKKSAFKVWIISFIDLIAIVFLFLLFLPLLVDTSSLVFINKPIDLFYLKNDFPIFFDYVKNTNIWFNGLIGGLCFIYLAFLLYLTIYFIKLIFNINERETSFTIYLLLITIGFTIALVMTAWSITNVIYYMKVNDTPILLLVFTLIPGIDILTLLYWIPQLLFHFWNVFYLTLNLFWSIFAFVGLGYATFGFWILFTEGFNFDNNENRVYSKKEMEIIYMSDFIKCEKCPKGTLKVKEGQYGVFLGCNNFPNCKFTMPIWKLLFKILDKEGVNLYKWPNECWKCKNNTDVYAYFPSYQLNQVLSDFNIHFGGPEFLPSIDNYLKNKYSTININFSKTIGEHYISNNCSRCNALQGRNFIIDDPHELWDHINNETLDSNYLFENITTAESGLTELEVKNSFGYLI